MQEKLRKIDRELIELIGNRIKVLAESASSYSSDNPDLRPILDQAGIPEFVWQNLVIGCAASLKIKSSFSSPTTTQSRRVTIIGGRGMMGHFFTQRLSAAGHDVTVLEYNDWEKAEELLATADLVLVCVPIECAVQVISQAAQYIAPTTALADIASIKTPIVKAMLEYHSGPVMGLHPMFGPGIKSFLSQKVVVCPGRGDKHFQWLLDLVQSDGGKLVYSTPEEHDRMMVDVQAIRNFTTLSMGAFFSKENLNIRRSLDFASPLYRHTIAIVSRLFAQSAPLVVDLILATPERRQAISRLANNYSRLAQLVNKVDRDGLIQEFETAQNFFAQEIPCGLKESTHMINALSTLLAAQELEQKHQVSSTNNLPRKFTSISFQKSLALFS